MAQSDFGFSLSENSVNEINSLIEQYSQEIIAIMNGFQDDLIEHISIANYDKLLKAVDGIIELYNNSVRYELKTSIHEQWQEACESMTSFAERMEMGDESEQVAAEIEAVLSSIFDASIDNRLHEVDIDGRTSASIADFENVNEIFESVASKVQEMSEDFNSEAERLGEENEFYKFIVPVVLAYSGGVCNFFRDATKNLETLEDSYVTKMAEKRDSVQDNKQEVDLSDLLDFSDLAYAGMGSVSQATSEKKKDKISESESNLSAESNDSSEKKYEKLIQALRQFDGKACTYPELRKKYDEHLAQFHKNLEIKVKAEYDKRDKALQQYHKQLELQLQSRHKELDGRYIKGTITLQQAEYMYAESCAKADQLYQIRKNTLWQEYQVVKQNADRIYNNEVTRCNQIAQKALQNQQLICRSIYDNKENYISRLKTKNADLCVEELRKNISEVNHKCPEKCNACKLILSALELHEASNDDGFIDDIKREISPLNSELKGFKRRKDKLSWENNLLAVNSANYNVSKGNLQNGIEINGWDDNRFTQNCQRCVITYEVRRRGFDVVAKERLFAPVLNPDGTPKLDANGKKESYDPSGLPVLYKNGTVNPNSWAGVFVDKNGMIPQPIEPNGNTVEQKIADIEKRMRQYGDGARAIIRIQRMKQDAKGKISKIGGHVFMVEQINGKTVFCDPQTGAPDVKVHNFGYEKGIWGCLMRVCDPKCQGNSNANLCVVCYPPQNEGKNKGVFIIPNEIRLLRVDNLSISNRVTECCK